MPLIETQRDGTIGTIILDHRERRNALSKMLAGADPMSPRRFERVQGLRRIVYDSKDYAEGIHAFREKRRPKFSGQ